MTATSFESSRLARYLDGLRDGTHGTFERVGDGVPFLSAKNVQPGGVVVADESMIGPEDAAAIVASGFPARGDVLLTIVGSVGRSAVYEWEAPLPFQRSVAFLRADHRLEPAFLCYQLQSKGLQDQIALSTKTSAQPGLYLGQVAALVVAVPHLDEQRAIIAYLDRETARIDTLIGEQQRLIDLLRERRSAALVDAFASMRAQTPTVAREPIPWLPDLHVEQAQMRHLCSIGTGSSDSANAVDEGYPFFVRGDQPLALDTYEFDTEAIITAGDGAMVGRSFHHFRGKFAAHQRVYVLRDFNRVFPRYLYWYFSTFFIRVVGDGGAQATVPSVRMPMIAGMPVPIPAYDEQRRIAAYLDEQTEKLELLITEAERFIDLVKERRAALITAAVTGQIDVRAVA